MIDHSDCTHPSTPSGRSKCRRDRAKGVEPGFHPPLYSLGPPPKTTERVSIVDLARERNRGTTPRDRDMQCDVCGVERIMWRGTDILSQSVLYVGERCFYYVKQGDPVYIDKRR